MKGYIYILVVFSMWFTLLQKLSSQETVPAIITPEGYIFIDVTFNDSVKARLMFDTGGGMCVLSGKLYKKLKTTMVPSGLFTGFRHDGERLDAELFMLPKINIGQYSAANVKTAVYPPLDEYGIDGIISLKEFENTPVTIDFKNGLLIIENNASLLKIEKSASGIIPLLLHMHTNDALDVFVTLCLNDSIKIEAEFDTGSGYNTLLINPYYLKQVGIDSSSAEKKAYITPSEKRVLTDYSATLGSIKYCDADFIVSKNVSATFRQGLIYEGLIGSGLFRDRLLTIDIPNRRLLVR